MSKEEDDPVFQQQQSEANRIAAYDFVNRVQKQRKRRQFLLQLNSELPTDEGSEERLDMIQRASSFDIDSKAKEISDQFRSF